MRTVLLFGDSNTWGYVPGSLAERWPRDVRWAGRLASALSAEWEVIAEGLNGRTATLDSPTAEGRNGLTYFIPCLQSHMPLDAVVIYLGTNDVGDRFRLTPSDAALAVARLVRWAGWAECGDPRVLVICPPPFDGHVFGAAFAEVCAMVGCDLLDLEDVAAYSDLDRIHLDADGHAAVAAAVQAWLRELAIG
jgi:lysophospholipase L1-like esterase